jgi:hypothetical protein
MAPPDPLHELRERLRATQDAAERLTRDGGERSRDPSRDELDTLVAVLRTLRDLVPPELQHQLAEVIRQVLLLLRAVIDFWVARLEPARAGEVEVQDIPID